RAMTHKKDEDYFDYIRRIKSNPAAVAVKLADLRHNSDTSRLSTVTEKDIARLKKYRQAERILTDGE
ncbi:MAG: GTP pyrophosphokinase, partial [Oscillospiraceae bacterium]|nr:GTP pyrophosphokinase [Oscillospiraceae bacterium]